MKPLLVALLLSLPQGVALAGQAGLPELIQAGDRRAALELIEAGADVNAAQPDGTTALQWAVYRVDVELVKVLLARGARADVANTFGTTPLGEAARIANVELIELLARAGAPVDRPNHDGQTPLMLAVRTGSLPAVQALLAHGAGVNARENWRGQTALMWAAADAHADIVRLLVRKGADVNARAHANDWRNQVTSEPRAQYRPTGGMTPLIYAARSGCVACIDALLDAGADIDLPNPDGVTPLMTAIDNVRFDAAMRLIERGANPHLSDWWGRTALYVAVDAHSLETRFTAAQTTFASYNGVPDENEKHTALDVARALLARGVEVNTQLNFHRPGRGGNSGRFVDPLLTTGATPLLRAAYSRDVEMVELLLAHGALPDLPNVTGVTPLMAATGLGGARDIPFKGVDATTRTLRTIDLLLAAGADVNAILDDPANHSSRMPRPGPLVNRAGQTPLYGAVLTGNTRVIAHLLEKGARVDVKDRAGRTPYDEAREFGGGRDPDRIAEIVAALDAAPSAVRVGAR